MRTILFALAAIFAACDGERPVERAETGELCEHGVLASICTRCNPALIAVFRSHGDYCEEHGFPESVCPVCHPERGGRPAQEVEENEGPADGMRVRLASPAIAERAGIAVVRVPEPSSEASIDATARVAYDPARVARVGPRAPGVVREVVVDLGSRVTAGTVLAWIESAEVGADRSRIAAAESRVAVAESARERQTSLGTAGMASQSAVQASEQELAAARAELAALRASLRVVGGRGGSGRYALSAPIDGMLTRRDATPGSYVDTEHALFEIVETSRMIAELAIPEQDLARVAVGRRVELRVDGSDRAHEGVLDYVAPEIDPHTRTALGRVVLENPDGALRANLFADARIFVPAERPAFRVPREALQIAGEAPMVFARIAPDLYEVRRVTVASEGEGTVDVIGRLEAGEEIVTTGSFLLKTETMRDSIGAGCCEEE